jgi:16S rRNA (guanine527-N7)-methyltransferase
LDYKIIDKYFAELNDRQKQQIENMHNIYSCWNERINVVSRKDVDNLYTKHVLHSLSIAKIVSFLPHARVLDVGTGGGFPVVPLAVLFPETEFFAVDSVGKKIKVLENVCRELDIRNIEARCDRAENITGKFDFVTGRAVTSLPDFYGLTRNKIKSKNAHTLHNGIICLKGGNLDTEIADTLKKYRLLPDKIREYEISNFFDEDFFSTKKILYIQVQNH